MAHAKKFLFSTEEQLFSAYCKAMGHPARWRILNLLRSGRVQTLQRIADEIPLSYATIQDHLIRLERVDLIMIDRDIDCEAGYRIRPAVLEEMCMVMGGISRGED